MHLNSSFWKEKRVLITGHTGFVGSWMSFLLTQLGAKITGYAKHPVTDPNLYSVLKLDEKIDSNIFEITHFEKLQEIVINSAADIIFHLAAQPLVSYSYHHPVETFNVNIMGTTYLLESFKNSKSARVLINITTDKCYRNTNVNSVYTEDDPLGGYDPYSSSKACSEIVTSAYRDSYDLRTKSKAVATARAGNIIGGGDWSADRLIPDFFRAAFKQQSIQIRNQEAIRPWQFILEPIYGYLLLAEKMWSQPENYSEAWNFGPEVQDSKSVKYIIESLSKHWPVPIVWEKCSKTSFHESQSIMLDSSKSKMKLDWHPQMTLDQAIEETFNWYKNFFEKSDMVKFTESQIERFFESANLTLA